MGFKDNISVVDELSSARMSFRTKPRIKDTISQAAALAGVDDSTFTMSAAYQAALTTIEAHERTRLQPVDHVAFFEALDNPPEPTDALRAAAKKYRKRVSSR